MPSTITTEQGERVEIDFLDPENGVVPMNEAVVNQWFGRIRSGKTYGATAQALDDLNAGNVVYTSWLIKWEGYDERKSWWKLFLGRLGLKKEFIVYPKENYHYLPYRSDDPDRVYYPFHNFFDKFYSLTDCTVYLDEAQSIMNSYERLNIDDRKQESITYTGHLNRSINIISQRAAQIHTIMRANIARWYEMSKDEGWFGITFTRKEYQNADGNNLPLVEREPDEIVEYKGKKEIFEAYDSKYMRGDMKASQKNFAEVWKLTKEQCKELMKDLREKNNPQEIPKPSEAYLQMAKLSDSMKTSPRNDPPPIL